MNDEEMKELLIGFDQEFDAKCAQLAELDEGTFLGRDVEEDLVMELAAVSNAARYMFMKLRLLQHKLQTEHKGDLNIAKDFKRES